MDLSSLPALEHALAQRGARAVHAAQLLRAWAQHRPTAPRGQEAARFLPRALHADWPAIAAALDALAALQSRHPGEDGSERLLVRLADGQTVESVLLPRGGLCVSTQAGCAVGCVFCMTGRDGLLRQLGSAEIVAQVVLARRLRAVGKVVFMGMGEPAHNLDAVLEAIEFLGTHGGIAHKSLVFSTVGDARAFERLPLGRVKPALALSLHTTRPELRAQLLPRAPRIEPAALVQAACDYAESTGHPLQLQWTLLDGVNDGEDEAATLATWLRDRRAMVNLIPWNRIDGLPWRRPELERTLAMARALKRGGVLTRLRWSAGQDVDGGCGQLRVRALGAAAGDAAGDSVDPRPSAAVPAAARAPGRPVRIPVVTPAVTPARAA
jgi:23S rRNA (adenine2503-C2)-methyltransferase